MEMQWIQINQNEYAFQVNGQVRGTLQLQKYGQTASVLLMSEQQTYQIKRIGFWKSKLVVLNNQGMEVLRVAPKSWFSNSWNLEHQAKSYQIKIDNCPLVEFSIIHNQKKLITYALSAQNAVVGLSIQAEPDVPELFHLMLWFFIRPIIQEQTGQEIPLVLLT
jgi:hypothetical protein